VRGWIACGINGGVIRQGERRRSDDDAVIRERDDVAIGKSLLRSGVMVVTVETEIRELAEAFCKAVENQDAGGVASFYEADARMLAPDTPMIEGQSGIEAFVQQLFGVGLRTLKLETVDVLRGGNLAVEVGRFTMGFAPEGSQDGKYMVVYRRQADGGLKIVADSFNSDAPVG
jgi:uncharacterized protein (TIGR02246 family)